MNYTLETKDQLLLRFLYQNPLPQPLSQNTKYALYLKIIEIVYFLVCYA